jgi:TolA-binding protein
MTGTDLEIAGRLLQEHVNPTENAQAKVRGRARLIRYFDQPRRRPRAWPALAMAAAVVALVLPLGWWWRSDDRAITFTEGPDRQEGKVGAYVSPPVDIRWALAFSDGSVVELEPQSHGRVTRTTPRGAEVLLENGRARVEVVHRPKTDWSILAGPYTVRVTGTSFEVAFEARTQTLEVVMRSGTVLVEGPGISKPVEIQGAQRFVHRAGSPETSSGTAASPSSEAGGLPRASVTPPTASAEPPRALARASGPASPSATGPVSWAALAARGQYQVVLEQADRLGLGRALSTTKAVDLMALGHAARFAGRTDLAARAYQATRARFGATSDAANAAFFLGRMVEGQSPNMAIGWYERYVSETPRGTWVAEALGRRMVLLKKSGAHEAALEAARQYQERFPKGPYAGVAREMTTPP